jgi:hypothetical protein
MPLVAQITGAVALTALIVAPWWAKIPEAPAPLESTTAPHLVPVPLPGPIAPSPALTKLDAATGAADSEIRPAHLNLDVRHTFGAMDLSVTVDGRPALTNQLDGGGKRFKMFGKRAERGFTRTLDLSPGVHVVRVRLKSTEDEFDQTRVERFDLGSASVAGLQITADKSGMSLVANHPPPPPKPAPAPVQRASTPASNAPAVVAAAAPIAQHVEPRTSPAESAVVELVQSLRSMLIAIAGFVASAATGFVVQEFLRRRKGLLFAEAEAKAAPPSAMERRRRRRAARSQGEPAPAAPE